MNLESAAPGYCKNCRQMEMKEHGTVLTREYCDKLKINYIVAHTKCCEKANCKHPYWYSTKG
jgi:hypothetical protein